MPEKSPRRRLNLLYDPDTVYVEDIAENFYALDKTDNRIQTGHAYLELNKDDRPWLAYKSEDLEDYNGAFISAPADIDLGPDGENKLVAVTNFSSLGAVVGRLEESLFNIRYATGSAHLPGSGAIGTNSSLTVTFPANYFQGEPLFFMSPHTSVPDIIRGPTWSGKTKSSVNIFMTRSTTTATGIRWFAFEVI